MSEFEPIRPIDKFERLRKDKIEKENEIKKMEDEKNRVLNYPMREHSKERAVETAENIIKHARREKEVRDTFGN